MATTLYTIGHSSRAIGELVDVLAASRIGALVDVRAFPQSRRHPQFNRRALEDSLAADGIGYSWQGEALGGFRKPRPDSRHTALRIAAFRGFADYMETGEFGTALGEVLRQAAHERLAIMCAEREPAECHRALIADAALARGARVIHLIDRGESREARLTDAARIAGEILVYDAGQPRLLDDA